MNLRRSRKPCICSCVCRGIPRKDIVRAGRVHHVLARGINGLALFRGPEDYRYYLDRLEEAKSSHHVSLSHYAESISQTHRSDEKAMISVSLVPGTVISYCENGDLFLLLNFQIFLPESLLELNRGP